MSNDRDRDKALEMALAQIDKQYGKGAIMKMGERTNMNIEAISTGRAGPRPRPRHRWPAAWAHHRDLRSGVVG